VVGSVANSVPDDLAGVRPDLARGAEPDASSLGVLYRDEWKQLVRLAALLLGDVAAGEDVVQEAFVRLAGRDRGWDGTVRLSTCAPR
jgi:DNA-directed RNA polymerase specialized sigma24 family protein